MRARLTVWLDGLALAGVALFCALLLRRTLAGGGAMLGYDLYTYFFPAKTYAAGALRRGELPLWNPDLFLGAPFLANVQMAVLYPPDLLFAFLEFPPAVAISQWLHLVARGGGDVRPVPLGLGPRPPGGADRRPGLRRRGLLRGPHGAPQSGPRQRLAALGGPLHPAPRAQPG